MILNHDGPDRSVNAWPFTRTMSPTRSALVDCGMAFNEPSSIWTSTMNEEPGFDAFRTDVTVPQSEHE